MHGGEFRAPFTNLQQRGTGRRERSTSCYLGERPRDEVYLKWLEGREECGQKQVEAKQ